MYGQLMEGGKQFVHCREVVLLSECPLSEVFYCIYITSLYVYYIIARQSTVVYVCMYVYHTVCKVFLLSFIQLRNLERKWQHHEQTNFAMKECIFFTDTHTHTHTHTHHQLPILHVSTDIASRQAESNYQDISDDVRALVSSYNSILCHSMQGTIPPAAVN